MYIYLSGTIISLDVRRGRLVTIDSAVAVRKALEET